jgi:hypothetical protein
MGKRMDHFQDDPQNKIEHRLTGANYEQPIDE